MYYTFALPTRLLSLYNTNRRVTSTSTSRFHRIIIIMAPRLAGYFCGPHLYSHNDIDPNRDDVCIVCREPFTEERAIRLTNCSHVVGADCFRDWVRHHPNTCPYWNHPLPRTSFSISLLERACNNEWFQYYEELVYLFVANGNGGPQFTEALDALHRDRASLRDFIKILWSFGICAVVIAAIFIMVDLVLIGSLSIVLWPITLWTHTALPTLIPLADESRVGVPFASYLNFMAYIFMILVFLGIVAVTTFMAIVATVLVVSMCRSVPQRWARKLGVLGWRMPKNRRKE